MQSNTDSLYSHEIVYIPEEEDILFHLNHDSGSYVAPHWHNSLELIYMKSGELEVTLNNTNFLLGANDILLINSKTLHSTKCVKGNDAILLFFPYQFLKKYLPSISNLYFTLNSHTASPKTQPELDHIRNLLNQMLTLHTLSSEEAKLKFTSLIFELLSAIYENFKTDLMLTDTNRRNKNLAKLDPIFQYTRSHCKKPISIPEISAVAGLQPEYFCRFFKKNMGITYLEYLNEVRLAFLYQDLLSTDLPISRLLDLHGFTNYKLFRRIFRDRFHATPGEIRRRSKT